jgi:hypothetical protein
MRDILNKERLPQIRHWSCGLSLTTSHSAHNTAFCRATAFSHLKPPGTPTAYELFITEPPGKLTPNCIGSRCVLIELNLMIRQITAKRRFLPADPKSGQAPAVSMVSRASTSPRFLMRPCAKKPQSQSTDASTAFPCLPRPAFRTGCTGTMAKHCDHRTHGFTTLLPTLILRDN